MNKKAIAYFFSIVFMAFIMAPTVIVALDKSIDTSIFYSLAEGENNHVITPLFSEQNNFSAFVSESTNEKLFASAYIDYSKPHLNLVSPPPEQAFF